MTSQYDNGLKQLHDFISRSRYLVNRFLYLSTKLIKVWGLFIGIVFFMFYLHKDHKSFTK